MLRSGRCERRQWIRSVDAPGRKVMRPVRAECNSSVLAAMDQQPTDMRVAPQSRQRLKDSLKELTSRSAGKSFESVVQSVNQKLTGWIQYFRMARMKSVLEELASRPLSGCRIADETAMRIEHPRRLKRRDCVETSHDHIGIFRFVHRAGTNAEPQIAGE